MLDKIYDSLLTLVYPQACIICGRIAEASRDGACCSRCWAKTPIFSGKETLCQKCGKIQIGKTRSFKTYCRECDSHFYDRAIAVGAYEYGLAASVISLKKVPVVPGRLKTLFVGGFLGSPIPTPTFIIPVPLSKSRILERGFNQSMILARLLGNETGIHVNSKSLFRSVHSKTHRAGLDRRGRELTVEKSFKVAASRSLMGADILLVDDVLTSGATASVCAKVLKKNGAKSVCVFTIARAG